MFFSLKFPSNMTANLVLWGWKYSSYENLQSDILDLGSGMSLEAPEIVDIEAPHKAGPYQL